MTKNRGGRFGVTAFAILLTAVISVLTWSLYPEMPRLIGDDAYKEANQSFRPGGAECLPTQIERVPANKRVGRMIACDERAEDHRLQANDLLQQRRAASAAEASARVAYDQTRIAAWGLMLGGLTMGAAIAAAFYARSAALHSEEAASSFIDAERAVLNAQSAGVGYVPADGSYPVVLTIRNRGRATARITEVSFDGPDFASPASQEQFETIISGGDTGYSKVLILSENAAGEFIVHCVITYRTIGNRLFKSHFDISLERKQNQTGHLAWIAEVSPVGGHPLDT